MSSEHEIWPAVLDVIGNEITKDVTFNLWFGDLELKQLIDDKAYLQTVNLYKKKTLETKFYDLLKNAFCEVMGFKVTPYIISIENRGFEEQLEELLEKQAAEQLQALAAEAEQKEQNEDEFETLDPRVYSGKFHLNTDKAGFPKQYNPASGKVENVPMIEMFEDHGNKDGSFIKSENVPEYKPIYTFENFVQGDSNRDAYSVCLATASYPAAQYNPLFIYGPPGIGKTHLLYAIADHVTKTRPSAKIIYTTSEDFTNELHDAISTNSTPDFREKYRTADILMIDDIQFIGQLKTTQLEFFNTFNTLFTSNKHIVVASDRPPKDIALLEKRIRSRFESGAIIEIMNPDPELRTAIIKRKAIDMGVDIPNEAIKFISDNVRENIRQIEGIIKSLSIYSILYQQPITEELVRMRVGNVVSGPIDINPDKIISLVSKYTDVSKEAILGKNRSANITLARHLTAYLLKHLTQMNLMNIGAFLNRHHSTISDSVAIIEKQKGEDSELNDKIKGIMRELGLR